MISWFERAARAASLRLSASSGLRTGALIAISAGSLLLLGSVAVVGTGLLVGY